MSLENPRNDQETDPQLAEDVSEKYLSEIQERIDAAKINKQQEAEEDMLHRIERDGPQSQRVEELNKEWSKDELNQALLPNGRSEHLIGDNSIGRAREEMQRLDIPKEKLADVLDLYRKLFTGEAHIEDMSDVEVAAGRMAISELMKAQNSEQFATRDPQTGESLKLSEVEADTRRHAQEMITARYEQIAKSLGDKNVEDLFSY